MTLARRDGRVRMGSRFLKSSLFALIVLLGLGLEVSPLRAQGSAQERILFNAKIFTADPQNPYAEAIAIRGERIMAVGSYPEVAKSVTQNADASRLCIAGALRRVG